MNKFVTIKPFKTFNKVKYYTFHIDEQPKSETDTFFETFETNEELADDLNTLVTWIGEIGNRRGAKNRYFRAENAAEALPPPAQIMAELTINQCELRLYCVRLTDEVVILANEGRKKSQAVQNTPELMPMFRFANKMAQQLLKLLQEREITIQGKEIINLEDLELWA